MVENQERLFIAMLKDVDLRDKRKHIINLTHEKIKRRFRQLQALRTCQGCGNRNVRCSLNFPCRHYSLCAACRHYVRRCPQPRCLRRIDATQSLWDLLHQEFSF
ncbi:hypothetical protein BgiBS90_016651 [Biomphalaria glabrata]|nr:hypothetical protein BgiBS90_016651 [Biomphalaria glabrata]